MEGELASVRIGGLDNAIVGPETLPPEFNLSDPYNPQLCVALEPSNTSRFGRIVLRPANQNDPWQRFEKVVLADGSFELMNRHSEWSITISHISRFVSFPVYVQVELNSRS